MTIQISQTAYANASMNVEARLARWVLMTHDRTDGFELSLTHDFLAMMLGIRRPGVTTAIHVLEGTGMIRAERGRIIVLNREKLEELADDAYGMAEAEYERLIGQA
jgi:CRP-like cAMP-binding protein